jgi:hypothetical protein
VDSIRVAVGPANFRRVLKSAPNYVMIRDLTKRRKENKRRRKRVEKANKNKKKEQLQMFGELIDVSIPKKKSLCVGFAGTSAYDAMNFFSYDYYGNVPEITWSDRQKEPMEDDASASQAAFQVAVDMAQSSHASQQTGRRWALTVSGLIEELSTAYEEANFISTQLFALLESEKSNDDLQSEVRFPALSSARIPLSPIILHFSSE